MALTYLLPPGTLRTAGVYAHVTVDFNFFATHSLLSQWAVCYLRYAQPRLDIRCVRNIAGSVEHFLRAAVLRSPPSARDC